MDWTLQGNVCRKMYILNVKVVDAKVLLHRPCGFCIFFCINPMHECEKIVDIILFTVKGLGLKGSMDSSYINVNECVNYVDILDIIDFIYCQVMCMKSKIMFL